jgi:hypothetical protein
MFMSHAVDGKALLDAEFGTEDLRELGVTSNFQCRRIQREIAVLAAAVAKGAAVSSPGQELK